MSPGPWTALVESIGDSALFNENRLRIQHDIRNAMYALDKHKNNSKLMDDLYSSDTCLAFLFKLSDYREKENVPDVQKDAKNSDFISQIEQLFLQKAINVKQEMAEKWINADQTIERRLPKIFEFVFKKMIEISECFQFEMAIFEQKYIFLSRIDDDDNSRIKNLAKVFIVMRKAVPSLETLKAHVATILTLPDDFESRYNHLNFCDDDDSCDLASSEYYGVVSVPTAAELASSLFDLQSFDDFRSVVELLKKYTVQKTLSKIETDFSRRHEICLALQKKHVYPSTESIFDDVMLNSKSLRNLPKLNLDRIKKWIVGLSTDSLLLYAGRLRVIDETMLDSVKELLSVCDNAFTLTARQSLVKQIVNAVESIRSLGEWTEYESKEMTDVVTDENMETYIYKTRFCVDGVENFRDFQRVFLQKLLDGLSCSSSQAAETFDYAGIAKVFRDKVCVETQTCTNQLYAYAKDKGFCGDGKGESINELEKVIEAGCILRKMLEDPEENITEVIRKIVQINEKYKKKFGVAIWSDRAYLEWDSEEC